MRCIAPNYFVSHLQYIQYLPPPKSHIFLPPVTCNRQQEHHISLSPKDLTIIVCPSTYENNGLATAKITLAASLAVPALLSGISAYAALPAASFCACGIPRATLLPSGVVTKAPSSFAAVRRVRMWPNATLNGLVQQIWVRAEKGEGDG